VLVPAWGFDGNPLEAEVLVLGIVLFLGRRLEDSTINTVPIKILKN